MGRIGNRVLPPVHCDWSLYPITQPSPTSDKLSVKDTEPAVTSVKTLRTQDTSDPRHFGTSAEVSIRHFGTSAERSGHFGTSAEMSWDTSALRKILRHCATLDGKVDACLRNTVN